MNIWQQCNERNHLASLRADAWRVVGAHGIQWGAKLTHTPDEQDLLEAVLPPRGEISSSQRLHPLLSDPFRPPPLRYATRFGRKTEHGIWYGALTHATAFCEVAFHKLRFAGSAPPDILPIVSQVYAFSAAVHSNRNIDLCKPPWKKHRDRISSPTTYADSQPLGTQMRRHGVETFLFFSARAPDDAINIGMIEPAFERIEPLIPPTLWAARLTQDGISFRSSEMTAKRKGYAFERRQFVSNAW